MPMLSRGRPPRVPSISHDGIRYEQVMDALELGFDQESGYLAAVEEATGNRLWALKIYDNRPSPELEADVQVMYFKAMELQASSETISVTNEAGRRFIVDIKSRTVRAAD